MPVYLWGGVLLLEDDKVAVHEDCCCGGGPLPCGPCGCLGGISGVELIITGVQGSGTCECECYNDTFLIPAGVENECFGSLTVSGGLVCPPDVAYSQHFSYRATSLGFNCERLAVTVWISEGLVGSSAIPLATVTVYFGAIGGNDIACSGLTETVPLVYQSGLSGCSWDSAVRLTIRIL